MEPGPDCSRPSGLLRRAVALAARDGEVRGVVEDDYHHFRVVVRHRDGVVTEVTSQTPRIPWTGCAFAGDDWSGVVGQPLEPRSSAIAARTEMKLYCTHMFELAGLAMAAAARGLALRRYDAEVPYGARRGEPAVLRRDGEPVLTWRTDGDTIQDPPDLRGVSIRKGFAAWVENNLGLDEGEAALILRRAVFISGGRTSNLDAVKHSYAGGGCYTTQPARAPSALRVVGSTHDFEHRPEALLRDDQAWLAFEED
jgi:hypothetical protein